MSEILPKCPKCQGPSYPQSASFADIYEPTAVYDDPRAGIKQPTGYYICKECGNIFIILPETQVILAAIHERAKMWNSDRCKRSSLEDALERKRYRHGYEIAGAHAKVQALIDQGVLKEKDGYILEPTK